jgi:hypothetical protein
VPSQQPAELWLTSRRAPCSDQLNENTSFAINQIVCMYSQLAVSLIGSDMRLEGLDRKLMIALDMLLEEKSVSRSAKNFLASGAPSKAGSTGQHSKIETA